VKRYAAEAGAAYIAATWFNALVETCERIAVLHNMSTRFNWAMPET